MLWQRSIAGKGVGGALEALPNTTLFAAISPVAPFVRRGTALLLAILTALGARQGNGTALTTALSLAVMLLGAWEGDAGELLFWGSLSLGLTSGLSVLTAHARLAGGGAEALVGPAITLILAAAVIRGRHRLKSLLQQANEHNEILRLTADYVPHLLWRSGANGTLDFLNRRWTIITGCGVADALENEHWLSFLHPDDVAAFGAGWREARQADREFNTHARLRYIDGSYRWMHMVARPFRSPRSGQTTCWFGGATDVDATYRKHASSQALNRALEIQLAQGEDALVSSESRYRAIFEQTHVALLEQDLIPLRGMLQGLRSSGVDDILSYATLNRGFAAECARLLTTVDANDAAVRMLGAASREAVLGSPARFLIEDDGALLGAVKALFEGTGHFEGRLQLVGADGRRIVAMVSSNYPSREDEFSRVVTGLIDISEWERSQEDLARAQRELARSSRVATLGAISTSIAHDVNQPIGSLVTDANACRRWLRKEPPDIAAAERALDRVIANGRRASDIVGRTRDRIVKERRLVAIDLSALITETVDLVQRDWRSDRLRLRVDLASDCPPVLADRCELQQVLVNLLQNAAQATATEVPERRIIGVKLERDGDDGAIVGISDRGIGIADADLARLFDPFFSTKADGMGMGLAIAQATIKRFGGTLSAANREGGGAVFHFCLPSLAGEKV